VQWSEQSRHAVTHGEDRRVRAQHLELAAVLPTALTRERSHGVRRQRPGDDVGNERDRVGDVLIAKVPAEPHHEIQLLVARAVAIPVDLEQILAPVQEHAAAGQELPA
jgi:hypothetical protein